jgi:biofilm PGA synthesis N-glycosyltransferase PgaC
MRNLNSLPDVVPHSPATKLVALPVSHDLPAQPATVIYLHGSAPQERSKWYLLVRDKLFLSLALATLWTGFSIYVALPWMNDLANAIGWPLAIFVVTGVALIPGYSNAFIVAGLLFDHRPQFSQHAPLPPLSILVAAYNEQDCIADTLASYAAQHYDAPLEITVIDDGSTDATAQRIRDFIAAARYPVNQKISLLQMPRNGGKARALNAGLAQARHPLVVTTDADTLLFRGALASLVLNHIASPKNTAATAGAVLVRNSRTNLITRLQEWDYFLGIAVVKRIQSLLQGTLVAQGAFSIYRKDVLLEVGGWEETVGEDIVLTWAMMCRGYRIGYAENAFVFTNVPESYGAYYRQRKRWARGLVEAFKRHPRILTSPRLNTPFVYLNLAFPYLDLAYLLAFIPGVIAAVFFQNYLIVGLLTLLQLPLSGLCNSIMFYKQRRIFLQHGLKVRKNVLGAVLFAVAYQVLLAPASCMGYLAELVNLRKSW